MCVDVMPNNFRCTDQRSHCCILRSKVRKRLSRAQFLAGIFSDANTELGTFFYPKRVNQAQRNIYNEKTYIFVYLYVSNTFLWLW